MKKLTYETYFADPQAIQQSVELEARRMRSREMQRLVFDPLFAFCARLLAVRGVKLLLDPRQAAAQ